MNTAKYLNLLCTVFVIAILLVSTVVAATGDDGVVAVTDNTNDTDDGAEGTINGSETDEADTNETDADESEEKNEEEDLGILPNSPWYFLDRALDRLTYHLERDPSAKAAKGLAIAKERLLEIQAMAEAGEIGPMNKAAKSHAKITGDIEDIVGDLDDLGSVEALAEELDIEEKIEEYNDLFSDVSVKIKGDVSEEVLAAVEDLIAGLEGQVESIEIKVLNSKAKIKVELNQSGVDADVIEDLIVNNGLANALQHANENAAKGLANAVQKSQTGQENSAKNDGKDKPWVVGNSDVMEDRALSMKEKAEDMWEKLEEKAENIGVDLPNSSEFDALLVEADELFEQELYEEAKDVYEAAKDFAEELKDDLEFQGESEGAEESEEESSGDAEEELEESPEEKAEKMKELAQEAWDDLKSKSSEYDTELPDSTDFDALIAEGDAYVADEMFKEAKDVYEEAFNLADALVEDLKEELGIEEESEGESGEVESEEDSEE